uniref:Uncharacterized protein n=1 Tax=Arundo donax TaxID=35708 RepID=A0A0A9BDP6_ARUDO
MLSLVKRAFCSSNQRKIFILSGNFAFQICLKGWST